MSFDIIYDPEKGIAALIDPEAGRALGPLIAAAEDGAKLIEMFVSGLNRDPATVHPADLEQLWRTFTDAMKGDEAPAAAPAGPAPVEQVYEVGAAPQAPPEPPSGPAPVEQAQPGESGGIAGPAVGTEQAAPAGGGPGGEPPTGLPATGGLPSGIEQAAPPGGHPADPTGASPPATPTGSPGAAAPTPGAEAPPQ